MKRLAQQVTPRVQRLAALLENPVDVESYLRTFWVTVPDPVGMEFIRPPDVQLEIADRCGGLLRGDCDDAATLAASILHAQHWPCYLIALRPPNSSEFAHVFCRVPWDFGFLDIDPIMPLAELPIRGYAEMMMEPV